LDIASVTDHKETAIFNVLPQDDSSVEDLLSMDNNSVVETQHNLNEDKEQNESKNDENPDQEYTYSVLNELGNKIISFPELKSRVEDNFVCIFCHDASHTTEKCPLLLCTKLDPFAVLQLLQDSAQKGTPWPLNNHLLSLPNTHQNPQP